MAPQRIHGPEYRFKDDKPIASAMRRKFIGFFDINGKKAGADRRRGGKSPTSRAQRSNGGTIGT
jgi:hypothetical protein